MNFTREDVEQHVKESQEDNAFVETLLGSVGVRWADLDQAQRDEFIARLIIQDFASYATRIKDVTDSSPDNPLTFSLYIVETVKEGVHAAAKFQDYVRELEAARMNATYLNTEGEGQ